MNILLTGSSGFIGSRLAAALRIAGHTVLEARRDAVPGLQVVETDFTRDTEPGDWLPRLIGVDAVINAVGILREQGAQTFEKIHTLAPRALFTACAAAGVRRIVQISALGADTGDGGYFSSKRRADEHLAALPLDWTIVQPSLAFGTGGPSARLFTMLATLPVIPVPGDARQGVQPIHVDDLIECIVQALQRPDVIHRRVALVGPEPLTLREFLAQLKRSLGLPQARFVRVPLFLVRMAAAVAQLNSRSLLDRETLRMLEAGNTADPSATRELLGRPPRDVSRFVDPSLRDAMIQQGQLQWLLPPLRWSIALMWIWTGLVSLGLYPRADSLALLARTGLHGMLAQVALAVAAGLDLALGVATLAMRRRRWLWLAQLALILGYTAVITVKLPEFWLHPYGPVLKNLPLLACIVLLYRLEAPSWNTSS